jgi:hypothetical protein
VAGLGVGGGGLGCSKLEPATGGASSRDLCASGDFERDQSGTVAWRSQREYRQGMTEAAKTDRGAQIAIGVGVFLGTVLWGIFSPYSDDDVRDWVGLFFADGLGVVTFLSARKYLRRGQQDPTT